jgi:putative ABC transport system permease protein
MSYSVTQRTQEIGIRMALGAQVRDIFRLVIGGGLRLTLAGTVLGLGGALAIARMLHSMAPDLAATDPILTVFVALVLIAVALFACWLPARRAARVNPVIALRAE